MAVGVVWLVRKVILVHDFTTHEGLEGKSGQHVQAEEEARDVDHEVILGEVVEHVAEGFVAKGEVARERHDKAGNERDASAIVGDTREAVDCGFA